MLLDAFFPPQASLEHTEATEHPYLQRDSPPLQKEEVRRAIFGANPNKAPGPDGIQVKVWRELRPVLQDQVTHLFRLSLDQGNLPDAWKVAKIIPLRKGGNRDFAAANNYRPISLLATLGKALEAVVAERISYLVEAEGILPHNHFRGRKQRSTVHALSYLQEKVFSAWRRKQTVSVVNFDVKGAYNNVNRTVFLERLREQGIPEVIIRWIASFCSDRKASILVNEQTSEVKDLPHAGLPQGSPLSPILFLFFNASLVQHQIQRGGSMAYVDDYSAWTIGPSAAENTLWLQQEVIPLLEKWERESGAVFDAGKTSFIHLTRVTTGTRGRAWESSSTPSRQYQSQY